MANEYLTEIYEALAQRLNDFEFAQPFTILWGHEQQLYVYGRYYIEPSPNFSPTQTQDMGKVITSKTDGKFKLTLRAPERHGIVGFMNLADALNEHFFPGDEPVSYALDDDDDKQAVLIQREPSLEKEPELDGGFYTGALVVHCFIQPVRP